MDIVFRRVLPVLIVLSCLSAVKAFGQPSAGRTISMDEAVKIALSNNPVAKNAELRVQAVSGNQSSIPEPGGTEISLKNGQLYSGSNDLYLEIDQHLGSPLTHIHKVKYSRQLVKLTEAEQKVALKQLTSDVKTAYTRLLFEFNKWNVLKEMSGVYEEALSLSGVPYDPNDSDMLERITAETLFADFQNQRFQAEQDYKIAANQLQEILNITDNMAPSDSTLELYAIEIRNSGPDKFFPFTFLSPFSETLDLRKEELSLQKSYYFPEITGGYFNQRINHTSGFQGFVVGISVPVWYLSNKAKVDQARINREIAGNNFDYQRYAAQKTIENLRIQLDKFFVQISFYRENALKQADMLIQSAVTKFEKTETGYVSYFKSLDAALQIRISYLEKMKEYNESAIQLEYYLD